MKSLPSVFATDEISRNGVKISIRALVSMLADNYELGNLLLLSHDSLRPIGRTMPTAIHLEPGMARLAGLGVLADTDKELEQLNALQHAFLIRQAKLHQSQIATLRALLGDHLKGEERVLCKEALAFVETGLATRAVPEYWEGLDRDGLMPLNRLTSIAPGVFKFGELVLFAHPYLRRSLSRLNSLNMPFLAQLQTLPPKYDAKVALDPDMVGLASSYRDYFEFEYWWGPKFDDKLSAIPRGVTKHGASETERLFHAISATEFWWKADKEPDTFEFELEELRDIPTIEPTSDSFGCRYVHARGSELTNTIEHFDGAIRMYSSEAMIQRLEVDLKHAGKKTDYTKLWRLDGALDVPTWKRLLSDYYRDNFQVGEYLGAAPILEDEVDDDFENNLLDEYVPYRINAGEGIRVALSFRPLDDEIDTASVNSYRVYALETLSSNNSNIEVIDAETVELRKVISRLGLDLEILDTTRYLYCEDQYTSFPLIYHGSATLPASLDTTMEGLRTLMQAWDMRALDRVASYCIEYPLADRVVQLSVLGHAVDLLKWLSHPLAEPPADVSQLGTWAENVGDYLQSEFPSAIGRPSLWGTLMPSGFLKIMRKPIDAQRFQFELSVSDGDNAGLVYKMALPSGSKELWSLLENRQLSVALAHIVENSVCENCGKSYRSCKCIKAIDAGVIEVITDCQFGMAFWTDRPSKDLPVPTISD